MHHQANSILNRNQLIVVFLTIIAILIFCYSLFLKTELLNDEIMHFEQIEGIMKGDLTQKIAITMIPGFHYLIAFISKLIGDPTIASMRAINLIISLFCIIIFFLCARKITKDQYLIKTIQFVFLPVLFPFIFLIYTDPLALLLFLISLYALLAKKYHLSGLIASLSLLIRQDSIIWLVFLFFLVLLREFEGKIVLRRINEIIDKTWVYILGIEIFFVFFIVNRGIAMGDRLMHPAFQAHTENVFFLLFLFFFLLLPFNILNFKKIIQLIKEKPWIIALLVLVFIGYLFTFKSTHPYNNGLWVDYYLRNRLIIFFTSSLALKTVFFLPMAYSILSLAVTKFYQKNIPFLLYYFGIAFLLFHWLIDPRYYIVPFAIFLLFRKGESQKTEIIIASIFFYLSVILIYIISKTWFFL